MLVDGIICLYYMFLPTMLKETVLQTRQILVLLSLSHWCLVGGLAGGRNSPPSPSNSDSCTTPRGLVAFDNPLQQKK